jgi:protein TonB
LSSLLAGSLTACSGVRTAPTIPATVQADEAPGKVRTYGIPSDPCDLNDHRGGIDSYKIVVANHIARTNLGNTFEGKLPPMLPAVVVLRISVDSLGRVVDAYVQRSRDDAASKIALASVQRSGNFPLPCSLINGQNTVLSFSETFLFNGQYQLQLRSIAGPQ